MEQKIKPLKGNQPPSLAQMAYLQLFAIKRKENSNLTIAEFDKQLRDVWLEVKKARGGN